MAAQPSPSLSMEDVKRIAGTTITWIEMQRLLVQGTAALLKQVEAALNLLEQMVTHWVVSLGAQPPKVSGAGVQPPRT